MQKYHFRRIFSLAACLICCLGSLTGCGKSTVAYDDVITNEGYDLLPLTSETQLPKKILKSVLSI